MSLERGLSALAWILAGYAVSLLIAAIASRDPLGVLSSAVWVYTSAAPLTNVALFSAPIAMAAIGLSLAYRAKFITVGPEGQIILGSVASLWLVSYSGIEAAAPLKVALALLLAAFVGAAYAVIPLLLRLIFGASETLSSLMLNFVAMYLTNYLIATSLRAGPFVITRSVPDELRVGPLVALSFVALTAIASYALLTRTSIGLAIEVYGRAPRAALTYGYSPASILLFLSLFSGALSGLGGGLAMLSFQSSLSPMSFPPGYGYAGALVAWLSGNSPLLAAASSLFFSSITVLGRALQPLGVSYSYALAAQAIIVLFFMIGRRWR